MKWLGCGACVLVGLLHVVLPATADAGPSVSVRRNAVFDQRPVWPGDFNGDGITDLVGSSRPDPNAPPVVTVLLGRGDGTFSAPIRSQVMGDVYAVGDVNNDGHLDVLVQQFPQPDEDVLVVGGNGDGTFDAGHRVTTVYQSTFGMLADLDGDGNRDIVIGEIGDGSPDAVTIFRGHGDFTFALDPAARLPVNAAAGIALDLNNDGRRDVVVSSVSDERLSVFRNDGNLQFTAVPFDTGRFHIAGVTAGDVNGDGIRDLIYTETTGDGFPYGPGYVHIALGLGDGTFSEQLRYQVARGAWKVVVGDFTRDGVLDIATANRSAIYEDDCGGDTRKTWDSISILTGVGDGTFRGPDTFSIGNQLDPSGSRDRNAVSSLNTSDLNGDGATDLIVSGGTLFLNQPPDPNWAPTVNLGPDLTLDHTSGIILLAAANDVDQDMLTYQWTNDAGISVPPIPRPCVSVPSDGTWHFTVTVDDGQGHQASDTITLTVGNPDTSEPKVTILSPLSGGVIPEGEPFTFRWHISNPTGSITQTGLIVSPDGETWISPSACRGIAVPPAPSEGDYSCTWNNPEPPTTTGVVYVTAGDTAGRIIADAEVRPVTIRAPLGFPAGWKHQDIGAVGAAGDASYDNGIFTVKGSGADIWNSADAFHYAYRFNPSDTGAVEVITRVDSVQNVNAWTKAGVMLRSGLDAGAVHASLFVSPGKGIAFQRRTSVGGASEHTAGPAWTAPVWLRLTARGGQVCASTCRPVTIVRGYYRRNATDGWTFLAQQQFAGAPSQFTTVGLAVSSHVTGTVASAQFSNVTARVLPAWTPQAVGSVSDASAEIVDDMFTLRARGADIWGASDQFLYVYTTTTASAVTARVTSVSNANPWSKAGVMFRASRFSDAAHVMVVATPGKGVAMQYRASTGGPSAQIAQVTGVVAPVWVKLTRSGATYTGFYSSDGSTWRTLGSITLAAFDTAGLAVTSHTTSASTTATFERASVEP